MASATDAERESASYASGKFKNPNYALHNQHCQVLHEESPASERLLYSVKRNQKFLSALPSLESAHMARNLTEFRRSMSAIEDDGAASEWETIAPANEITSQDDHADSSIKQRTRDYELAFHAQDILPDSKSQGSPSGRRNTIAGLLDLSDQRLPFERSQLNLPTHDSVCSSSSFYSDTQGYDEAFLGSKLPERHELGPTRSESRRRPVTLNIDHNISIELGTWRCSEASSSTCGDPFKYDGATYSAFLQPAAVGEVSSAIRRFDAGQNSIQTTHPFQTDQTNSFKQDRVEQTPFYNSDAIRST